MHKQNKNNAQVDDAHDIDVVIPMYNLIEYSDNYLKTSEILWQYWRDVAALEENGTIVDFATDDNIADSFKIKEKNNRQNRQQWHKKC